MIFNIAVVEDEEAESDALVSLLERYRKEYQMSFSYKCFENAFLFLQEFKQKQYDLVFMDINMPGINGLDAAKDMRKIDPDVVLFFVTDLAQYAIKGYEVEAYDFIVKPANYSHLQLKLTRLLPFLEKKNSVRQVMFNKGKNGPIIAIDPNEIKYIEVISHDTIVHTTHDEIHLHQSLNEIGKILPENSFFRCNYCYIVNLKFISKIEKYDCYIGTGEKLQISHPRKKNFMAALMNYLGEKI